VFQADRYRGLAVLVRSCRDVNKDAASFFSEWHLSQNPYKACRSE
jgi:hypothetical protein